MSKIEFRDLGEIDYKEAWDYQEGLFDEILSIKNANKSLPENQKTDTPNYLLFCEHPHVFTLGKSGKDNNLLINEEMLKSKGISFYKINRGGDITYHGPGQIVGYPIIDLENFKLGVKEYVHLLEEAVMMTLSEYGISSGRLEGATGVWLDATLPGKARKICAIGVRASRYITMHGFAFNINTQLDYYRYINPCGFIDKGVTSMQNELGAELDFEKVKKTQLKNLLRLLETETE